MKSSWKTTLIGLAAAGLNLLANGLNWKQVLLSLGVAALGSVAKDSNVTGGTVDSGQIPNKVN